jgi:hypothetical protein
VSLLELAPAVPQLLAPQPARSVQELLLFPLCSPLQRNRENPKPITGAGAGSPEGF